MKKMISEQTELRNYWLTEAISDEAVSIEIANAYRNYFDAYGRRSVSEFGPEVFHFVLAELRFEGKTW